MKRYLKKIAVALISTLMLSCSPEAAESQIQQQKTDNPISPWDMQAMLGRGFDVQWAEFPKKIDAYGADEPRAIKAMGFSSARIRTALPADDYLFGILDERIADCLDNGIIPVLAYNAKEYEACPDEETLKVCTEWWGKVASHFKNATHRLVFNLNIEWSDKAGKSQECIDKFNEEVTAAIRSTNPTRILIYSSAKLSSPEYLDQLAIPKEAGKFAMAEWHLYAAGPSKDPSSVKYWSTGTASEKKAITDKIATGLAWQQRNNIPTWVGAWMPGNYNKGNDFTVDEQCNFASFMVSALKEANIPWAVNSLDKYYDTDKNCWIQEMMPLVRILAGKP